MVCEDSQSMLKHLRDFLFVPLVLEACWEDINTDFVLGLLVLDWFSKTGDFLCRKDLVSHIMVFLWFVFTWNTTMSEEYFSWPIKIWRLIGFGSAYCC